jgi:hypothetical protein
MKNQALATFVLRTQKSLINYLTATILFAGSVWETSLSKAEKRKPMELSSYALRITVTSLSTHTI